MAKVLVLFTIYDNLVGDSVIEIEGHGFRREEERWEKEGQSNKVHELGKRAVLLECSACGKMKNRV